MAGPYNLVLFDDCCHAWISTDTGATFIEGCTPGGPLTPAPNDPGLDPYGNGTLFDAWTDGQMAINDADYLTLVGFDNDYVGFLGIVGVSPSAGLNKSWTLRDPEKSTTAVLPSPAFMDITNLNFGTDWQVANMGAATGSAQIILSCTNSSSSSPAYPRISRDKGVSWSDVTGVPADQPWACAAFSAGGTTMYLKPDNYLGSTAYIYKSTDSGVTWAELAAGPVDQGDPLNEASMRLRCSADGQTVVLMASNGIFWLSKNGGTSWTSTNFQTILDTPGKSRFADCSVTPDGGTIIVSFEQVLNAHYWPAVFVSTNGGTSFTNISANLQYPASVGPPVSGQPGTTPTGCTQCNVAPDGLGLVVTFYAYKDTPVTFPDGLTGYTMYANVSEDAGATFALRSFAADAYELGSFLGLFTGIYITPSTVIPPVIGPVIPPAPGGPVPSGSLIGCTYRRVSAYTTESPAFTGWHRHDLGHARSLSSIGATPSGDTNGLLDNLDMVTTDGTNNYVEGLTQMFDEDDVLTDAWFVDGGLVPDSAYEDTDPNTDITGIRFTGLNWLINETVTVCAFGLDPGDFKVDAYGTVFVPYGSGVAPTTIDYTAPGAGAYLFTAAFIAANLLDAPGRNGAVAYSGGFIPCCVGYPFTSQGQLLRPAAPDQAGSRIGPAFGHLRRSAKMMALFNSAIGVEVGTTFTDLFPADRVDGAAQLIPTQVRSGMWRETIACEWTLDAMLCWQIKRPYPASVVSVGAGIETTDTV